jgi:two-component system LytT family response regulator
MINAIIIEDEFAAFTHLNNIIESSYSNKINVVGHETSVEHGIKLISELSPQLVFLDIELKDGNGFEILDHFANSSTFEVIFTTGLKDYKEKAMDYFAFYYLNKPIIKEQLITVIDKFLSKQSAFNNEKYSAFKNQIENQNKKISLPMKNGDFHIIDIDDIMYCEADGSYTHFFTKDNKTYITSNNLKKVENILQHTSFFRIHRSVLLNLKHITHYNNSGEIKLSNSQKLLVSTRNKSSFLRVLKLMNYSIN